MEQDSAALNLSRSRQTSFPLYPYPLLPLALLCLPIREPHPTSHVQLMGVSTHLTHQRVLVPSNLSLAPMVRPRDIQLPCVARTYNFCQLPRDNRKRGAKPPPKMYVRSSASPRPLNRIVRSCIYRQCDRHLGLQEMRQEWGQGSQVILRIATACGGVYLWRNVFWEHRIVRCCYQSALMHFSCPKMLC